MREPVNVASESIFAFTLVQESKLLNPSGISLFQASEEYLDMNTTQ
jgi:hypothetical protein